ncbi:MAG TPA: chemotaxis protein CheW [Thermodesulfovibrionales bacterium]|nr:chemotaxis protein CheW [Thermodesulfovibrionales bacterium]
MDIAKIRKKSKDTGTAAQRPAEPATDIIRDEAVQRPTSSLTGTASEEGQVSEGRKEEPDAATIELLTFALAREEYAFRIDDVHEIIKPQRVTKIPRSEHYLIGITSLRGRIIPVLDLKKRLSLVEGGAKNTRQKILILKGPKGPIGAMVDRVIGVIRPQASKIGETPAHLKEGETKFIEGVALLDGRFISIIKTTEAMNIE